MRSDIDLKASNDVKNICTEKLKIDERKPIILNEFEGTPWIRKVCGKAPCKGKYS